MSTAGRSSSRSSARSSRQSTSPEGSSRSTRSKACSTRPRQRRATDVQIDVLSIFPAYLDALRLSLAGKAQVAGLLQVTTYDLRDFTTDKHRSVDDTPYGGGAGMVMKAEPWGQALDALATDSAVIVVPTPSGAPFTQRTAEQLSTVDHLVFACGRYE